MAKRTKCFIVIFAMIIICCITGVQLLFRLTETSSTSETNTEEAVSVESTAEVSSFTDEFQNECEEYYYADEGRHNLLVYMQEISDASWDWSNVRGDIDVIYIRYETDHYSIAFTNGTEGGAMSSCTLMPLEIHDFEGQELPTFVIQVKNGKTTISPGSYKVE